MLGVQGKGFRVRFACVGFSGCPGLLQPRLPFPAPASVVVAAPDTGVAAMRLPRVRKGLRCAHQAWACRTRGKPLALLGLRGGTHGFACFGWDRLWGGFTATPITTAPPKHGLKPNHRKLCTGQPSGQNPAFCAGGGLALGVLLG